MIKSEVMYIIQRFNSCAVVLTIKINLNFKKKTRKVTHTVLQNNVVSAKCVGVKCGAAR
jgi:hypothetical protein